MPAAPKTRKCQRCQRNRQHRFFVGPRGRICKDCKKKRVQRASRSVRLQDTYGITQHEYELLLQSQGGVCAICKGKRPGFLDVDHDHALERSGVPVRASVRGVLCRRCNRRLLPAATDSVAVLESAISYLTDPPAQKVLDVL